MPIGTRVLPVDEIRGGTVVSADPAAGREVVMVPCFRTGTDYIFDCFSAVAGRSWLPYRTRVLGS